MDEVAYYVKEGANRLFRFFPKTHQQERWSAQSATWVDVAPALFDDIYSGRVELDEITLDRAQKAYPAAFGLKFNSMTVETMNRVQIAIMRKETLEEFLADGRIPKEVHAEVTDFWHKLYREMSETKLEPGQYWDVSPEWS